MELSEQNLERLLKRHAGYINRTLTLAYGDSRPCKAFSIRYSTRSIAKQLGKSTSTIKSCLENYWQCFFTVRDKLKLWNFIDRMQKSFQREQKKRVKALEFACKESQLLEWAHLSCKDRAKLLRDRLPQCRLTGATLHREMKKRRVTFKLIRATKNQPENDHGKRRTEFRESKIRFDLLVVEGRVPVYCDEMYAGTFNRQKNAFMVAGKNVEYTESSMLTEKVTVIGGFSEVHGNVNCVSFTGRMDQDTMVQWVKRIKLSPKSYFIVLDNWSVHSGRRFTNFCRDNGIHLVFTPTYTPQLNGAEGCWALVRQAHNGLRLQSVLSKSNRSNLELMKQAVNSISPASFMAQCKEASLRWKETDFELAQGKKEHESSLLKTFRMSFQFDVQMQDAEMKPDDLVRLLRDKFGGKRGLYNYLISSSRLYLPPYEECTLQHLMALITGKKAALYTDQVNRMKLATFAELSMEKLLPMMQQDPSVWKYMVDKGDRKKPRWSREYAVTILASVKPTFVKQVWNHASTSRLTKQPDDGILQNLQITNEFKELLTENPWRYQKRGRIGRAIQKSKPKKERKPARKIPLLGTLQEFNTQEAAHKAAQAQQ